MAAVPTGTLFSLATAFGNAQTVTAVTNAAEAVVTCSAHGYSDGDIVEITSGWGRANKRVFRVSGATTGTFKLEGFNTTDTDFYPAGTGIGTVREVSTWQQLSKVMSPSTTGGDPKTVVYKFVESDVEYAINDGFTATSMQMEFDDDDTTDGYSAMQTLTDSQSNTILKMLMRSGAVIYLPITVALNEMPILQDGQINRVRAQFAGNNRPTRYSA